MVNNLTRSLTIVAAVLGVAHGAYAQDTDSSNLPVGMELAIGSGVGYAPEYMGADDSEFTFLPMVTLNYQDLFFVNVRNQPYSGQDEAGVNLYKEGNLTAGVSVNYLQGRDANENGFLTGMGNIDWTLNGGAFARYDYNNFYGSVSLHHDLFNEHDGFLGKVETGYNHVFNRELKGIVGISADYGSQDFLKTYFGVSPVQSTNSGLPQYNPDAGFYKTSLTGTLIYKVTPGMFVQGTAEYGHLMDEASNSPVVQSDNQFFLGTYIGYMF